MTGQELFYALSFVDERYIEEADKGRVSSGMPWKKVLSVAACLCILLAGAVAMRNLGFEKAPEAAAPPMAPMPEAEAAPAPEAAPEAAAPEEAMRDEQSLAEPAIDPDTIFGPTVEVSIQLDGQTYLLETKEGMELLSLLKDQAYDVSQLCKCDIEFTVVTEFGVKYHVNLQEGFVRCEQGQAFLSNEDMQKIQSVLGKLPKTLPADLHHVAFAHLRILDVLEDGSYEVWVEKVADEPRPFDAGVTMTLVIDPDMIPAADRTDLEYSGDVKVDMLVEIKNGAYDAGINTLYAEGVFAAARE